tara:strand:+ start:298 stop:465 length:168 start_codon:yes stop_codon:yes gene_type:complete
MPAQGVKQQSAGIPLKGGKPIPGTRNMVSNNNTINPHLKIDNCPYKGNAVLNAND